MPFSLYSFGILVLHVHNTLSPMFSGINNNNFSFFGYFNLSFFVFVFLTLKKKIYFKMFLALIQVKAVSYHAKCFVTIKSI